MNDRQTSDTESCEILHENRNNRSTNGSSNGGNGARGAEGGGNTTSSQQRDLRSFDSDGEYHEEGNYINDELKYGAGHQSIDSNPVESQSEWSDDECREEATGKFKTIFIY